MSEIRVSLRQQEDGRWVAAIPEGQAVPSILAKGSSQDECLARVRRSVDRALADQQTNEPPAFFIEVFPRLAGVAEAAQIIGWDKRRVVTYIDRGRFPEPLQALASGRVWSRADVEEFARAWHARQARRRRPLHAPDTMDAAETEEVPE